MTMYFLILERICAGAGTGSSHFISAGWNVLLLLGHGGCSPVSLIPSQSLAHDEVAGIDHVGERAVWLLASLRSS